MRISDWSSDVCSSDLANEVFTRLRIWAAGHAELVDPTEAGEIFRSLDEESFWSDQHERDLLYALRDRWSELEASDRSAIEGRLLTGNFQIGRASCRERGCQTV